MSTELVLIRHGESYANVTPTIGGMRGDTGLTDRGHDQARRLGRRLAADGFRADVLYTSTLPRARQTADYVAEATGLTPRDEDDLQELRPGDADGRSFAEWRQSWPFPTEGLQEHPYQPMAVGGESWAAFVVRASTALTRLVDAHPDQRVVAVCHGGVIESSFYLAFGLGTAGRRIGFQPANTGLTRWRRGPADDRPDWTLLGFNDARHLDDAE